MRERGFIFPAFIVEYLFGRKSTVNGGINIERKERSLRACAPRQCRRAGACRRRHDEEQKVYRHYALIQRLGKLSRKEKAPDGGGEIGYTEPAEFSVDDSLVTRELLHQINDFLKKKPAETRKIFYLHYVLGLTIVQVADELGMTESGVKSRLYRTVNELKEEVKK